MQAVRRILVALLLAAPALAPASPNRYLVRPVYSNVGFSIVKWAVFKEEGLFRDFQGTLDYDPAHPEASRIEVVVEAKSLDTKNDKRDEVVRSADFLDAERYPTLTFRSTAVEVNAGGSGTLTGDLTIHGVTRRVRFPVSALGARDVSNVGKLVGFETTFSINRRDYGVLGSKWGAVPGVLDDEVRIHVVIGAIQPTR
jgi:polyisoprenoid-binding protein YceI